MEMKITGARISFASGLFHASAFEEGQQPKFGADLILVEESKVFKKVDGKWVPAEAKDIFLAVANEAWKGHGAEMLAELEASKKALRNGDKRRNAAGEVYEGYEGNYYITAKNSVRPTVLDRQRQPITEEDGVVYSGCYVNAIVDVYANTKARTKGVFAGLQGVQFAKDGESFGGGSVASKDAFDDLGTPESEGDSSWA